MAFDANEDGVADVVVGNWGEDAILVFYGPVDDDRSALEADLLLTHTNDTRVYLGSSLAQPADLASTGVARSLVVGAPGHYRLPDGSDWVDELGQVFVYDLDDLEAGPWATLHPHTSLVKTGFGHRVCAVDGEGDGVAGVLASAPADAPDYQPAFQEGGALFYVATVAEGESVLTDFYGALDAADATVYGEYPHQRLGVTVACGQDLDGDGYEDVAAGSSYS